MAQLTITHVVQHKTPQSGTWLHCFQASCGDASGTHNEKDKEYEGADATVTMNLILQPVNLGDQCRFHIGLDDDQESVCSPQAEDQTDGNFAVTAAGSQTFSAGDDWAYTIFWKTE